MTSGSSYLVKPWFHVKNKIILKNFNVLFKHGTTSEMKQNCFSRQQFYWATVCKSVHPMLSDRCPVCLSVTLESCGQTVGRIKMKLRTQVGPDHIVLDGDPAPPPPKGGEATQFSAYVVAKWLDGSRCHLVGR